MKPERVVFDANIWLSYFVNNRTEELTWLVLANELTVLSSPYLIAELEDVLKRPKFEKATAPTGTDHVSFHHRLTTFCITMPRFERSPDPKDNYLFDLAIQNNATHLVTGEKKLLALKEIEGIQIISLAAFKKLLEL
jgi:putative PIN family toxin of toxin-antitoxin system